jgi:hypothetical protein
MASTMITITAILPMPIPVRCALLLLTSVGWHAATEWVDMETATLPGVIHNGSPIRRLH